jgi:hypothetical protein
MTITTNENAARVEVASDLEERINTLNAEVQRLILLESISATPKSRAYRRHNLIRLFGTPGAKGGGQDLLPVTGP